MNSNSQHQDAGGRFRKRDLIVRLRRAIDDGTFRLLVLSRPRKNDVSEIRKVTARPVVIGGESQLQLSVRSGSTERHENLAPADTVERVEELFGRVLMDAHLFTTEVDLTVRVRRGGALRVKRSPPSRTDAQLTPHDREKNYLIPDGQPCPFLFQIGVMSAGGQVKPSRYSKFRQVNRFVEFVDDIYRYLPSSACIRVVDFGCGRSDLTYALHHFLKHIRGRAVAITGLDLKADVIADCRAVAGRLEIDDIEFVEGDLAQFQTDNPVHLAVSLHACDTATDDAIAQAIRWRSNVILAVPCCQHELAGRITSSDIDPLLRHGLFRNRIAALATDALRAQLLEVAGYRTQVVEFIDLEHTTKNVLLRAVRRDQSPAGSTAYQDYQRLKVGFGVDGFRLEQHLRELLPETFG